MEDMDIYIKPSEIVDCNHVIIKWLVEELTKDCNSKSETAVKLFYHVRDKCHYNMYATNNGIESYSSSKILERGEGWCMPKAILLTSLCRAAGIPARFVIATIRNYKVPPEALKELKGNNIFFPHTYNQLFLNNHWVKAAATFDRDICERMGVPVVEFDGKNDALLPQYDFAGKPYIEYIEENGIFADIPWEMILKIGESVYQDIDFSSWLGIKNKWQE